MTREWYLTFHGGGDESDLNNIHVYSTEGKKRRKALDRHDLPARVELRELRGFTFGPDGDLYVTNAFKEANQILRFHGACDQDGQHHFRDVFVEGDAVVNPGLIHPFNVAFDTQGDLFVSSQNTNSVLRFYGPRATVRPPGSPMPLPHALARRKEPYSPGTFCPATGGAPHGLHVVREAVFAGGMLYVADRDADCIRKYNATTGDTLGAITAEGLIDKPIHLLIDEDSLYIGNRDADSVAKCDLRSGKVGPFIKTGAGGLKSPAGLALGGDGQMYVASRGSREILRFQLTDGCPAARPFIADLEDDPEFIELVSRSAG